jgi:hypothetical protein
MNDLPACGVVPQPITVLRGPLCKERDGELCENASIDIPGVLLY